jgi:hypothetical protein
MFETYDNEKRRFCLQKVTQNEKRHVRNTCSVIFDRFVIAFATLQEFGSIVCFLI